MRLLVFGRTGQLARELSRRLPAGMRAEFLGREHAELAHPGACAAAIAASDIDAVVNAAAWTAVDRAEVEEAAATVVNGTAPGAMAGAAAAHGIPFLHVSTDYVFDGSGTSPWNPGDPPNPPGAYGRSKLAGEHAVQAAGGHWMILRTSWIFSAHGSNFVKTMLRLGGERDSLDVVADQVGGPTQAAALADAILTAVGAMVQGAPGGLHHFAGSPDTSWAGFARAIMARADLPCEVQDIPTSAWPTPAPRPLNSRLDCADFSYAFGVPRPDWRAGLTDVLAELQ